MGVLDETEFVERPQYFNGQRLFASDLQAVEALNREIRWLHNKSLHQPGIGSGFAVSGDKGDRVVTVGPGYALDKEGRELILSRELPLPIPPVAGEEDGTPSYFDLTVSYADELEEAETRAGVCLPRGVVRRREEPIFCWVPTHCEVESFNQQKIMQCRTDEANRKAILSGEKIVLARVAVKDCSLVERVTLNHRRSARSCRQPNVSGGKASLSAFKKIDFDDFLALLAESSLQLLSLSKMLKGGRENPPFVFLQGLVDTSSGQYLTVPSYLVTLQRMTEVKGGSFPLVAYWIRNEAEKGFEMVLAFSAEQSEELKKNGVLDSIKASWSISWVGVEG